MKSRFARGFTLIEMMVVVAVTGILLAIAMPSFRDLIGSQKVKSTASTLQAALLLTRSEALKRNTNVTLAPTVAGEWNSGWNISLTDGTVLSTYSAVTSVSISGGPTSVIFQSAGRVSASVGSTFKVSSADTSAIRCVGISLSGVPAVTSAGC